MSAKVTFDWAKAAPFIKEHEVTNMKKLAMEAKDLLIDFEQRYPKVVNENNLAAIIAQDVANLKTKAWTDR